ncbi:MAG: hypothetical protein JXR80_01310 [Deltaproteobacteria bacterium]|nr:hypothetical protein [Deltaproteobacteria bacterium]
MRSVSKAGNFSFSRELAIGYRHRPARCCQRNELDIGGQASTVIALRPDGRVHKFEMNDRCAAGTGKYLELVAMSLGFSSG